MKSIYTNIINFSVVEMCFLLRYPDGTREQLVIPATAQIRVRIVMCVCVRARVHVRACAHNFACVMHAYVCKL
jgi:hypothetical protein